MKRKICWIAGILLAIQGLAGCRMVSAPDGKNECMYLGPIPLTCVPIQPCPRACRCGDHPS